MSEPLHNFYLCKHFKRKLGRSISEMLALGEKRDFLASCDNKLSDLQNKNTRMKKKNLM